MARKTKPAKKRTATLPGRKPPAKTAKPDALDTFIVAAVKALDLPAKKAWLPAIRANLEVTLQHAANVQEFPLPDTAAPAPVFRA